MFTLSAIALFVTFGLSFMLEDVIVVMASLHISRWIILGIGMACIIFAISNIVMWSQIGKLMSKKKSTMVGELIYILGLQYIYGTMTSHPSPDSTTTMSTLKHSISASTISSGSIMGLGYDDQQLWTYRGKRPYPIEEPTDRDE